MVSWRNLVVNTEKARTITAYFEKGKRRNNNLGDNAVEPLRADPRSPSHHYAGVFHEVSSLFKMCGFTVLLE